MTTGSAATWIGKAPYIHRHSGTTTKYENDSSLTHTCLLRIRNPHGEHAEEFWTLLEPLDDGVLVVERDTDTP